MSEPSVGVVSDAAVDRGRKPAAIDFREPLATVAISIVAAAVYLLSVSPDRQVFDYYVRLADAFLQGQIGLTEAPSWLNELVPRDGLFYVPYPPMPAFVLLPIVAVFGIGIHQQVVSAIVAGVAVGLEWQVLRRFDLTPLTRLLLVAVFAFGTVLWYVAVVGSAWYFAEVVAVAFSLGAILLVLDRRWPMLAGFLLGCAAMARLPVGLALPFVAAMALGVGWPPHLPVDRARAGRTLALLLAGLAVPALVYATYNMARWGTPLEMGYLLIPGVLGDPIYRDHGILSLWYIPRNLYAMLFRSWNYVDEPPFLQPSWWGLSLFLTTPLYLWLFRAPLRDPRVAWAAIGIALTLIPIVTHGNVGVSQFGYRFSLDFQPLLFVVLAVAFERGMSRLAMAAGLAAIAINLYAMWAIGIGFVAY
jgi:hypothetical protein